MLIAGKEITFDKKKITRREWRSLWEPNVPVDTENAILAKFAGVEVDFIDSLTVNDFQLFMKAAIDTVNAPPDPN